MCKVANIRWTLVAANDDDVNGVRQCAVVLVHLQSVARTRIHFGHERCNFDDVLPDGLNRMISTSHHLTCLSVCLTLSIHIFGCGLFWPSFLAAVYLLRFCFAIRFVDFVQVLMQPGAATFITNVSVNDIPSGWLNAVTVEPENSGMGVDTLVYNWFNTNVIMYSFRSSRSKAADASFGHHALGEP